MVKLLSSAMLAASVAREVAAASLAAYNANPRTVSVSGLSSGGFMSVQLGVAYSSVFQAGFGVFAGGPYDCARNQQYTSCMNNNQPSITQPLANMQSWSGNQIDITANLAQRKIYMQVGSSDTTVGPNPMHALQSQLSNFDTAANVTFVTTSGAAHTFPTDFDGSGDNACGQALSPYISNCGYDGAGGVLNWLLGNLKARNTGTLSGQTVSFSQTGSYGAAGMDTTGYLYVPAACQSGNTVCTLHVALHGCLQSYGQIGSKFIDNTGYNMWADTNNIIVLYPQTTVDYTSHTVWTGNSVSNPNACWDWIGWYGTNADQHGGVQMVAIVNMVKQILSGYNAGTGGSTTTTSTSTTTTSTSTTTASRSTTFSTSTTSTTTSAPASTSSLAPLYGQCAGQGWTGPTQCAQGVCTSYSAYYGQCLPPSN